MASRTIDVPRRIGRSLAAWPVYPAAAADQRTAAVAGLELPVRATVAIAVTTLVVMLDFSRTFIPEPIQDLYRAPEAMRYQALERTVLFGVVPLLVVLLGFRDRPSRYGLVLGDWRWGIPLALGGCLVMTPIVLLLAGQPAFREFYSLQSTTTPDLLVTNALDLLPAEFLFRGFLMLTLVRAIGPLGVVVATLPFAFAHLGKPELELLSTLGGGLAYGWLTWRTRSIVWGGLAHVYILTLMLAAAGPPA